MSTVAPRGRAVRARVLLAVLQLLCCPGRAATKLLLAGDLPCPPRGFNSYDAFQATNESETLAQAAFMREKLLQYGWEYIVIDAGWYNSPENMHTHSGPVEGDLAKIDAWGRWIPHPQSYPSTAKSGSFRPISDRLHEMGLKFGVWVMRGIPWQAVARRTPIKGTNWTADEITNNGQAACRWGPRDRPFFAYESNLSHPGTRAYYESVAELYADWQLARMRNTGGSP